MTQEERDILIEIKTKVNIFNDAFVKHCEDAASRFTVLEKSDRALHRRVDGLFVSGVLAIIIIAITVWALK